MVAASSSVERLAELQEAAARLRRDALDLIARASAACSVSAELAGTSQGYRFQRKEWAALLAHIPLDPDHIVVICASCHRVRAPHGWTALPPGIEEQLKAWSAALVSHGYCPDCFQAQTPPEGRPAARLD